MLSMAENGRDPEDPNSLLSAETLKPSPTVITKLVKRLRALTLTLLPVEVDTESINDPTSRVITPHVIAAYTAAAGDFVEALPYCLLRARADFIKDANHNAADYGENHGRAVACEVLARRIVHLSPPGRLGSIMSTRYRHTRSDGDESDLSSALELAIDSHCTIFLSSSEAQDVVDALWRGYLIQRNNENNDIDYVHYLESHENTFWSHFQASRLSVPRYQNIFRVTVWLFFLVVYSQAVREPLERLDRRRFDEWEVALYVMSLSFLIENLHKSYQLLRFVTWRAFGFWHAVTFVTDGLFLAAFILRVYGLSQNAADSADKFHFRSFQVLSFAAPFIWMKIVTVFDGYKYIGTMQICVARMLRESGIFFALLSVLGLGFAQGLYALDAADGESEHGSVIVNVLLQGLLASPNYDKFSSSPVGLSLFYFWNMVTAVVLLNVLISLFSSAYADIVGDAEAQYLAFFASKTISMIRAPDSYVYPAPFNLIEILFVAPFEQLCFSMGSETYAKLNRFVMTIIFFIPLSIIALYESTVSTRKNSWMSNWLRGHVEEEVIEANMDPELDGELQITKVPFEQLVKSFPNTQLSSETTILQEIAQLRNQVEMLKKKLDELKV